MEAFEALKHGHDLICTYFTRKEAESFYINYSPNWPYPALILTPDPEAASSLLFTDENARTEEEKCTLTPEKLDKTQVYWLFGPLEPLLSRKIGVLIVDMVNYPVTSVAIHALKRISEAVSGVPKVIFTTYIKPKHISPLNSCFSSPFQYSNASNMWISQGRHYYVACEKTEWVNETVGDLLEYIPPTQTVVFCESRKKMDQLAYFLAGFGLNIATLHLKIPKNVLKFVLNAFQSGEIPCILACDGVEIPETRVIVHCGVPCAGVYSQRVRGRRGSGRRLFIILMTQTEVQALRDLEIQLGVKIEELPMDINGLF